LLVYAGDVVASNHPAVKGREELFGPAEPKPDLEQRTRRKTAKK
jgi:hypothetical protein